MHRIIVRTATGGFLLGLLSACAPLTEQQVFERGSRLVEAQEEFQVRAAHCKSLGGRMKVRKQASRSKPGYLDYETARCIRR
jgi:hypothetical protein